VPASGAINPEGGKERRRIGNNGKAIGKERRRIGNHGKARRWNWKEWRRIVISGPPSAYLEREETDVD
jgi:hypothetical protein